MKKERIYVTEEIVYQNYVSMMYKMYKLHFGNAVCKERIHVWRTEAAVLFHPPPSCPFFSSLSDVSV